MGLGCCGVIDGDGVAAAEAGEPSSMVATERDDDNRESSDILSATAAAAADVDTILPWASARAGLCDDDARYAVIASKVMVIVME